MKKFGRRLFWMLVGSIFFLAGLSVPAFSAGNKPAFRKGELIVKYKSEENKLRSVGAHERLRPRTLKQFKRFNLELVEVDPTVSMEEALAAYNSDPAVEYAEPNYEMVAVDLTPTDDDFYRLWGLHNTGQSGGIPDADIDAPAAWELTTGSIDVVIAVIDTGIDYTHEDLAANMWINDAELNGTSGVDDDGNGYVDDIYGIDTYHHDADPRDDHFHGTHCAGTIGAVGSNSIGVAGVNWDVQLMACKFLGPRGSGWTSGALECLEYIGDMKDRGVDVVTTSNSWGCGGNCYSQALSDAIENHIDADILFVAAAGNSNSDTDIYDFYPANYYLPNLLSIAATDHNDNRAFFSNYGRRKVHIGAPGLNVYSTEPRDNYGYRSGTSMATPHVAGLAALLKADDPGRDWIAIKNLILVGGDPLVALDGKTITGKRINANGSLSCLDDTLFSALKFPEPVVAGQPAILSAISTQCEHPVSPVIVSTCDEVVATLYDDGAAPDQVSGDGIFTVNWTPTSSGSTLIFSSPIGNEATYVDFNVTLISVLPPSPAELGSQVTLEAAVTGRPCVGDTLEYKFEAIGPDSSSTYLLCDWQLSSTCSWDTTGHGIGFYSLRGGARVSGQASNVWTTESYQLTSDRPFFSINDVSVSESGGVLSIDEISGGTATLTVSLSRSSIDTLTVDFQSNDGSATANADYEPISGILTFYPGEISKDIEVTILDDRIEEGNETFTVDLTNPSGDALLDDASGECTIIDDVVEGPGDLVMTGISLVSKELLDITVSHTVANYGSGYTTASYVGFYISTDSTITTDDIFIGERAVGTLVGGQSDTADTVLTIPNNLEGYYYLGAIADYSNMVEETDEGNNSLAGQQVDCTQPPDPPGSISVPTNTWNTDNYTVSWTASETSGVTYTLEEATNSSFTSGLRTVVHGTTALSAPVTGRTFGVTYYYRVRAEEDQRPSAWVAAANGCKVSTWITWWTTGSFTDFVVRSDFPTARPVYVRVFYRHGQTWDWYVTTTDFFDGEYNDWELMINGNNFEYFESSWDWYFNRIDVMY